MTADLLPSPLSSSPLAIPDALSPLLRQQWACLGDGDTEAHRQLIQQVEGNADFRDQLIRVWLGSDMVARSCGQRPELLLELLHSGDLEQIYTAETLIGYLTERLADVDNEDALNRELRQFRQREMLRIFWRDLAGLADLQETVQTMTWLAEACIEQALAFHYRQACDKWGTPMSDGQPQRLAVLGMGKLGARELNVSSDIDLIFTFAGKGETDGARPLDNQEFFIRLGQKLVQALDTVTADGFVFRTDMRLRPYGASGALALSFDAMHDYYQNQGRDWERYAMIKARPVAGDIDAGYQLLAELRPFVYRRYLDFSAIDAMRSMKAMIQKEEKRRDLANNLKLGRGGIREIEFIAQVFQLIWGGKNPRLQQLELLSVLAILAEEDYLPPADVDQLVAAYHFLRRAEHALQAFDDRQTQALPDAAEEQVRLALVMGYEGWEGFNTALTEHRTIVHRQFNELIAEPDEQAAETHSDDWGNWLSIWLQQLEPDQAEPWLQQQGYAEADELLALIDNFRNSKRVELLAPEAAQRLDDFMPRLLATAATVDKPRHTVARIMPLIDAVLRRTAYLVLLVENESALRQLVRLCAASPYLAEELARYPVLLDEMLDVRQLYHPATADEMRDELRQQMLRIPEDDVEQQMDGLRNFVRVNTLRVTASEITGTLPLMKVSDYLTWLAEIVLEEVFAEAWRTLVNKHGLPGQLDTAQSGDEDSHFIILGYGKLGGIELGYESDLDLVFVHDAPDNAMTTGGKPIENSLFYIRLGQRMIHLLTTNTAAGRLYEVDMRLRPSGASGLLVTSLSAFEKYQQEQAWTWEHQALVRARVVAGSTRLEARYQKIRGNILAQQREPVALRKDVVTMRQKMMASLLPARASSDDGPDTGLFDLKQSPGGIVDIEFIVQYSVLAWSQRHPELLEYPDNIRILEIMGRLELISASVADALIEAYKAFRSALHRLKLQQRPGVLLVAELAEHGLDGYREQVLAAWQQLLADDD